MQARAWTIFVDVDGQQCRTVCPLPHTLLDNIEIDRELVKRLDNMSCRQRYEEIKDQLSPEESGLLLALLIHISGGTLDNSSLFDMIRSHALMAYDVSNFNPVWTRYKLKAGQSALARAMFEEAVDAGLDYSFSTPITSIADNGSFVSLTTASGSTFRARRVVSTIPLNVLHSIRFSPPLSQLRQEAITLQHVNHMSKIHAEVEGDGMTSWSGCHYPSRLLYGYGDGQVKNGNAHVVAFGADERDNFCPEEEPEKALEAFNALHPMDIKRMVCSLPRPSLVPSLLPLHLSFLLPRAPYLYRLHRPFSSRGRLRPFPQPKTDFILAFFSIFAFPSSPLFYNTRRYRSSSTGTPTRTRRAGPPGGARATRPSTRTSSSRATATSSSPRPTGRTAGARPSTARSSRGRSTPTRSRRSFARCRGTARRSSERP